MKELVRVISKKRDGFDSPGKILVGSKLLTFTQGMAEPVARHN